jgi:hypothetical protein
MIRRQARPFSVVMPEIRSELALGLPRCTRSEKEIAMRLKPIQLVVTLALVILTAPLAADAQPLRKIPRIGPAGAFKQEPTVLNKSLCRKCLSNGI